jgi:CubicO group peptidase (beta-lactamase class C family)
VRRYVPELRLKDEHAAGQITLLQLLNHTAGLDLELIAEGDTVVGRFTCSATHLGAWFGQAPTGRRFERVDEVWILRFRDGRIVDVWSLEDTLDRLRQLGLTDLHG